MSTVEFRIPSLSDFPHVKSIWEDEKTMADVGGTVHIDESGYRKWYENMFVSGKDKNCYYLIFFNDLCAGEVSFHRFDPENQTAELNIKIKYEFRGKGIARQALDHILSVFFNKWNCLEMRDTLWKKNPNGIKVLKAYGFKEAGTDKDGNSILKFHRGSVG